jgi:hypothetical protein
VEGIDGHLGGFSRDAEAAADRAPRDLGEVAEHATDGALGLVEILGSDEAGEAIAEVPNGRDGGGVREDFVQPASHLVDSRQEGGGEILLEPLDGVLESGDRGFVGATSRLKRAAELLVQLVEDDELRFFELAGLDKFLDSRNLVLGEGHANTPKGGHTRDRIVERFADLDDGALEVLIQRGRKIESGLESGLERLLPNVGERQQDVGTRLNDLIVNHPAEVLVILGQLSDLRRRDTRRPPGRSDDGLGLDGDVLQLLEGLHTGRDLCRNGCEASGSDSRTTGDARTNARADLAEATTNARLPSEVVDLRPNATEGTADLVVELELDNELGGIGEGHENPLSGSPIQGVELGLASRASGAMPRSPSALMSWVRDA